MTALLALDTAGSTAGAAVFADGEVRSEALEKAVSVHSSRLFRIIDGVLAGAGIGKGDLTAVVVTRGPGTFTGLRVGLATAKGIAYGLGIPLAGVSTLEAMARASVPFPGIVAALLDAKKQQVYAGAWDGLSGELVVAEGAWDPSTLANTLDGLPGPCLLLGSGLAACGSLFAGAGNGRFLLAPRERWSIPPSQVALLGNREVEAGRTVEPSVLLPVYHRLSEAEEKKRAGSRQSV